MQFRDFTIVFSKPVVLHKSIADDNIRLSYCDFRKVVVLDLNDIPTSTVNSRPFFFFTTDIRSYPHTVVSENIGRFCYTNPECIVYPYMNMLSLEEMERETIPQLRRYSKFIFESYKLSSLIVKLRKEPTGEYFLDYYLNNKIIQNIKDNKRESKSFLIREIFSYSKKLEMSLACEKQLKSIIQYRPIFTHLSQVHGILKDDVTLFNYQLADVKWMDKIENEIDDDNNQINFVYSQVIPIFEESILYQNTIILPAQYFSNVVYNNKVSFKFFGGNIISEVGLGKTLTALYHIFQRDTESRNKYSEFVEFDDKCSYFYKRGKNKGTACEKKPVDGKLYCKDHVSSVFIEKRPLKFKELSRWHPEDFITKDGFIRTNTTLVIAPNQLCDQWVAEYYDKCVNDKRVILITTYDQFTNITLGDILFSDLVVVSYNFLVNSSYEKVKNRRTVDFVRSNFLVESQDKAKLFANTELTTFNLFHWKRVILDEAHEIISMPRVSSLKESIGGLVSDYKWNITGTPFPNGVSSFLNLISYNTEYTDHLQCPVMYGIDSLPVSLWMSMGLDSGLVEKCSHLFRRNTKESIRSEVEENIIRQFVMKLQFTNQERTIYDSFVAGNKTKNYEFLIKLCCHSELFNKTGDLIRNCKTLDEIQMVLLDFTKKQMDNANELCIVKREKIDALQSQIDEYLNSQELLPENEYILNSIRSRCAQERRTLAQLMKNYENYRRTHAYLQNAVSESDEESSCPICIETIQANQLAVTKCGHKFCWECISMTHSSSSHGFKCPVCNTLLTNNSVYLVSDTKAAPLHETVEDYVRLTKSTKIGNIIHFIKHKTNSTDKIILFSQWDELLHKVGDILVNYGIKLVYCQGSVYARKRAISHFTNDSSVNIILLSSSNAASGINLTVANKIILLEPVYGTQEYRENIETQAIGRADRIGQKKPIDVYRFIIEDTIESELVN
ncbi:hypothetical protein EB118_03120 [bacterium]|nr:hypothetical protein [bacterium]NDC93955.1 hypothetical protein [bacterium]NDD83450.1 hypothetical protein [bacterium]NDG29075.1 hypothetical protein [bacterium]